MLHLRQATFEDHADIAKLHADNWRKTYRGILSDAYLDKEIENDRLNIWYNRLSQPPANQFVVVALLQEKLAGFCCIYLDDDLTFGSLIDNLHVTYHSQKTGIARKLLSMVAKYINDNSPTKKVYLWVYESNHNARAAYNKLGGTSFETVEKENCDGTIAKTCRIIWNDASELY